MVLARLFGFDLRTKLLLILLLLLLLPWLGARYVQSIETLLLQQQAQSLAIVSKTTATLLAEYPEAIVERNKLNAKQSEKVTVGRLNETIIIDGYVSEWDEYRSEIKRFDNHNQIIPSQTIDPQDISAHYLLAQQQQKLSVMLEVVDDSIVFRNPQNANRHGSDALVLAMVGRDQRVHRYLLSASAVGKLNAFEYLGSYTDPLIIGRETQLNAAWQRTPFGYRVELSLPQLMIEHSLAIAVIDYDQSRSEPTVIGLGDVRTSDLFISLLQPVVELNQLLTQMITDEAMRIWLIDRNQAVIAHAGQADILVEDAAAYSWSDYLYGWFLKPEISDNDSVQHQKALFNSTAVQSALNGKSAIQRKNSTINQTIILAAEPIIIKGQQMGVVVTEQNTNAISIMQNTAVKSLLNNVFWVIATIILLLVGYVSWLSFRINRLNREVTLLVNGEGKLAGKLPQRNEYDELGELRQSFDQLFKKVASYNQYLEGLSSKLTHEIRTPIAVIDTSLEHLQQAPKDSDTYIERARQGSQRLSQLVSRMSEASRLEHTIAQVDMTSFDLAKLLEQLVPTYQSIYAQYQFSYTQIDDIEYSVMGSSELIAQMLDKLISNAIDFHLENTPIELELSAHGHGEALRLRVINHGQALPKGLNEQIFEPMVSIRTDHQHNHLGLGLHMVKLIIAKHHGSIKAKNWQHGVEIIIELPIASV